MASEALTVVSLKANIERLVAAKELVLPSNISPDAFKNAAIIAVQDNPSILNCTPDSIFRSIRALAAAGLVPDGKEAALVPFKTKDKATGRWVDKCQSMPMVFGLIKTARNSGHIRDIRAHIVYQNEFDQGRFNYIVGDTEKLEHSPILFGDRGEPIGCYAIAVLKDGNIIREFMTKNDIEKVRKAGSSQRLWEDGKPKGPSPEPVGIWKDWWEEMWKKSPIRRLSKRLSLSAEDNFKIAAEEDAPATLRDITPDEPRKNLAQQLKDQSEPAKDDADGVGKAIDGVIVDVLTGIPGSPEWGEGMASAADNGMPGHNPYSLGTQQGADWDGGFHIGEASKYAEMNQ